MQDRLPGKRVLVVEDNPILAFDLDDALRECGAQVIGPALDFASGLALSRADALDAAVLDIDIGGTPVWPIARELQQEGIPFVFVSGDCHKGLPEDLSGAACLHKPAQADAILATISTVIDRR